MLGWEYPPHVSGGLGTACRGLTVALAQQGVEIDFVLPKIYGEENAAHLRLVDAAAPELVARQGTGRLNFAQLGVEFHEVPALLAPYMNAEQYREVLHALETAMSTASTAASDHPIAKLKAALASASVAGLTPSGSALAALPITPDTGPSDVTPQFVPDQYAGDLFAEVERYASRLASGLSGDWQVIHAHDWMTFPAGIALAQRTGLPLVVHVHSLEQDRSGSGCDQRIVAIEHAGLWAASKVIAVSHYTRNMIHRLHGVPLEKIEVVHNGVSVPQAVEAYRKDAQWTGPVVLFLGRITLQKGPDYFVAAAARVAKLIDDAVFVMAGVGDMLPQVMAQVESLGLSSRFFFPGFLNAEEVERMYCLADVYVMPSVSEPFGITALEAMSYNKPVIVSRQSGVAELVRHALKVDFWDIDQLASQIVAVLRYPELRQAMIASAGDEVRRVHWDAAAQTVMGVYQGLSAGAGARVGDSPGGG
ncbi:MAG TPA: glycosyltransferase [Polyangiaceae bacterium]|nr:glycosyltransferase [Polyangiaceae bacterium]